MEASLYMVTKPCTKPCTRPSLRGAHVMPMAPRRTRASAVGGCIVQGTHALQGRTS